MEDILNTMKEQRVYLLKLMHDLTTEVLSQQPCARQEVLKAQLFGMQVDLWMLTNAITNVEETLSVSVTEK